MSASVSAKRHFLGILACIAALSATTAPAALAADNDKETLRAVSLLFRHGVISPKYNLPKVKADWPMGFMQLTEIGRRGMYERGRRLRARYVEELGFISPTYNSSEVYVRSSGTDRAQQTARMLTLGLYPPAQAIDASKFNAALKLRAGEKSPSIVKINTVPLNVDKLLRPWTGQANCRKYRRYVKSFPGTRLYKTMAEKQEPFLRRMAAASGVNEGKPASRILYQINEIYEPLSSIVAHDMPLPDTISKADLKQLAALSDWNYHYQFLGRKVGRLTGGEFVKQVIDNFDNSIKLGEKAPKFYLYSGHQRTILGVDSALGTETAHTKGELFEGRIVPLGSHYAFELHETAPKSYAIKVKFITDDDEQVMRIPGCDADLCPVDTFRKAVSDAIADDWASECAAG